jgi:beta-galactosidase
VRTLDEWQAAALRVEDAPRLLRAALDAAADGGADGAATAGLHRGTFDSVAGADHFLRLDGWTKGLAWVNGELLGRYWSLGPTHTLYVPGPLVRESGNELVLLELHGAASRRASFVAAPDLGVTEQ